MQIRQQPIIWKIPIYLFFYRNSLFVRLKKSVNHVNKGVHTVHVRDYLTYSLTESDLI